MESKLNPCRTGSYQQISRPLIVLSMETYVKLIFLLHIRWHVMQHQHLRQSVMRCLLWIGAIQSPSRPETSKLLKEKNIAVGVHLTQTHYYKWLLLPSVQQGHQRFLNHRPAEVHRVALWCDKSCNRLCVLPYFVGHLFSRRGNCSILPKCCELSNFDSAAETISRVLMVCSSCIDILKS